MTENITIKQLAEEDRPREKLLLKGKSSLSNAELIAILIRSGSRDETAIELVQRMLAKYKNDLHELGKLNVADLLKFKGIGKVKAITIIAALELGRRRQIAEAENKVQFKNSCDIFDMMQPLLGDLAYEEFWAIYLNKANKVIEREKLSSGGVSGTVVDVKMIMKTAIQKLASALVVCHNHPSGNLQPSDADIQLTRKIRDAGKNLDILLIDHLIIGDKNFFSFSDEGML